MSCAGSGEETVSIRTPQASHTPPAPKRGEKVEARAAAASSAAKEPAQDVQSSIEKHLLFHASNIDFVPKELRHALREDQAYLVQAALKEFQRQRAKGERVTPEAVAVWSIRQWVSVNRDWGSRAELAYQRYKVCCFARLIGTKAHILPLERNRFFSLDDRRVPPSARFMMIEHRQLRPGLKVSVRRRDRETIKTIKYITQDCWIVMEGEELSAKLTHPRNVHAYEEKTSS